MPIVKIIALPAVGMLLEIIQLFTLLLKLLTSSKKFVEACQLVNEQKWVYEFYCKFSCHGRRQSCTTTAGRSCSTPCSSLPWRAWSGSGKLATLWATHHHNSTKTSTQHNIVACLEHVYKPTRPTTNPCHKKHKMVNLREQPKNAYNILLPFKFEG